MEGDLGWEWLGRLDYLDALDRQRRRRDAILAGTAAEVVWLLEHDPVITTGRRGGLQSGVDTLPVVETERGGLATYHGPGQLVGYLLVDVGRRGSGVRRTVEAVERGIVTWLEGRGVAAGPRAGYPGVWVGRDKICAVGMHFRRGVSMHGFALNLTVDLAGFSGFVPCGVTDGGVTSLALVSGAEVPPQAAAGSVAAAVLEALSRSWAGG
ncbi:MAG: lipoyl(octanoyl) transferase LipB [Myxococcota bacterium]